MGRRQVSATTSRTVVLVHGDTESCALCVPPPLHPEQTPDEFEAWRKRCLSAGDLTELIDTLLPKYRAVYAAAQKAKK